MHDSEPHMDYHEDDKRVRREEYENNLMQAGLELERDEDVIIPFILFKKLAGLCICQDW